MMTRILDRMAERRFDLVYAPQVVQHLRQIAKRHHGLIRKTIERQLQFDPETETRNRKPLERPSPDFGTWELRLGPQNRFRVFYEVHSNPAEVHILAIGEKRRNWLRIGGEEIDL